MTPVYLTSTYVQESPGRHKGYEYSRSHNPTRAAYEACVASLESGTHGFAFASGCSATMIVLQLLASGEHVIAGDDMYGGTFRLFDKVLRPNSNLEFSYVDLTDVANLERAFKPNTKLVWLETPTNPMLKLCDIKALVERAHAHGALVAVDNTFMSPYFQRPLELGADIVVHSSTKYIGGHSDVVGGVVVTNRPEVAERLKFYSNALGPICSPFDAFLAMRSLKTLAIRMRAHAENAAVVADYLAAHPKVERTIYPGLKSHPQHQLARTQMSGFGGMVVVRDQGRFTRSPPVHGVDPGVQSGREPGRGRIAGESPDHHDPRLDPGRNATQARHHRHPDPPERRNRDRGRPDRGSGAGPGEVLDPRAKRP